MLPIVAHADRILDVIDDNRVTLVIGATGCGKSTQLPQMLRRFLKKRVLCVQPRRMAVVAVATRVAEELKVALGNAEVGYHIGAAKMAALGKTELMFVTAGVRFDSPCSTGHTCVTVAVGPMSRMCNYQRPG